MARIPESEIERLKREVSVERLAEARGIKLARHGADLIGLCPFHDDHSPSLVISPRKNLWNCLGACRTGGSVIDWVMRAEGISFRHAVELLREDRLPLAAHPNGKPPRISTVPKLPAPVSREADDRALLLQVASYYHETLKQTPEALKYLEARGLKSSEMIDRFQMGFANRTLGYRLPRSNRVSGAELRGRLQKLGIYRESGHEHFNGSVVIPVFNLQGEVVEMYGRKITPGLREGTPLHLYLSGPHQGVWNEEALAVSKEIILCEALIDALTFWCAGYRHVTTSYGINGFTDDHRAAIKKSGTTTYAYDTDSTCGLTSDGDRVKRVDAMGNVTCYSHDARHRVTAITYSGPYSASTPPKTFVYDAATVDGQAMANAKARLAEAYTGPASAKITDEGFGYDALGRPTDLYESAPGSNGYFHSSAAYWPNGALETLTLSPGNMPTMTYTPDGEGRVEQVTASWGQNPVVNSVVYPLESGTNPPTMTIEYGTTTPGAYDTDTYTYDPATGRMTGYNFEVNGANDTGTLTWNANGTLAQLAIDDATPGSADSQTCAYTHDDLGRIASANCGSGWGQTFSLDPFGNVKKSGSISWQPLYTGANQYQGYSYDADGNLLYDGFHSYAWDAEGRPVEVDSTPRTFDALGRAVDNANYGGSDWETAWSPWGTPLASMQKGVYWTADPPVPGVPGNNVTYDGSGLRVYNHLDWQGTWRLETTPARGMWGSGAFAPYGEPYDRYSAPGVGFNDYFTGQPEMFAVDQTGIWDFPYRDQQPAQGRWLSPDPAGLAAVNPNNPQTWNRYAYVANTPLEATDPTGLHTPDYDDTGCDYEGIPADCAEWLGGGLPFLEQTGWQEFSLGNAAVPLTQWSTVANGVYQLYDSILYLPQPAYWEPVYSLVDLNDTLSLNTSYPQANAPPPAASPPPAPTATTAHLPGAPNCGSQPQSQADDLGALAEAQHTLEAPLLFALPLAGSAAVLGGFVALDIAACAPEPGAFVLCPLALAATASGGAAILYGDYTYLSNAEPNWRALTAVESPVDNPRGACQ